MFSIIKQFYGRENGLKKFIKFDHPIRKVHDAITENRIFVFLYVINKSNLENDSYFLCMASKDMSDCVEIEPTALSYVTATYEIFAKKIDDYPLTDQKFLLVHIYNGHEFVKHPLVQTELYSGVAESVTINLHNSIARLFLLIVNEFNFFFEIFETMQAIPEPLIVSVERAWSSALEDSSDTPTVFRAMEEDFKKVYYKNTVNANNNYLFQNN